MKATMPVRYRAGISGPPAQSVPATVIVLTKNEEANISRCIATAAWASQVVVVDSGSTDRTVELAIGAGADILERAWLGWGRQRDWALKHPIVRYDWVFFLDADEWVSSELANEIAETLKAPRYEAYSQRFRLVFQGRWIRHCGWYPSVHYTRLFRRDRAHYGDQTVSEHAIISGATGMLRSDLVDDDLKGLARWLTKHVKYAELEAQRRSDPEQRKFKRTGSTPVQRFLKTVVASRVPARPLIQFLYMYIIRAGFLDGREGLLFCLMHSWFQLTVQALLDEERRRTVSPARGAPLPTEAQ